MTDYFTEYTEVLENKLGISDAAELNEKKILSICLNSETGNKKRNGVAET